MTIKDLQARLRELGRIRLGQMQTDKNGNPRPAKLDRFRLTSSDRELIKTAAGQFGGRPQPWGDQWEVVTETDCLDVILPPPEIMFSQWYELWSAGGCERRCDGTRNVLTDSECECIPGERECQPTTRLSVMLAAIETFGVWRLETHGYYAATELAGAYELVRMAAANGARLPARLRVEQRQVKRRNEPQRDFVVPALDLDIGSAGVAQITGGEAASPEPVAVTEPAETPQPEPVEPVTQPSADSLPAPEVASADDPHERALADLDEAIDEAVRRGVDANWNEMRGHAAFSAEHAEAAARRVRDMQPDSVTPDPRSEAVLPKTGINPDAEAEGPA